MELTEGALLGGKLTYRQPREGFRTGIEPVLMAASVTARPGERVLEGGTGAGAGLLCLLARVPGVHAVGVERDEQLAGVARGNLTANGMGPACVLATDLLALPDTPPLGQATPFDHAMANPPWYAEGSTASPDARRDAAKRARPGLLANWAVALARMVRPGGSLTFIIPAGSVPDALAAFASASLGGPALLPFWPRAGLDARLVLLRATKGGRGACRILPGIPLHDGAGYSNQARGILWDGLPIAWQG